MMKSSLQPQTGTTDWYVKWISMLLAVAGIFLISASFTLYGQMAYIVSCIDWIYVGMQWGDRAIMIGSSVSCTAIAMNVVNTLTLTYFFFFVLNKKLFKGN